MTASASWSAWSCTVHVAVTDPSALPDARRAVEAELAAMDDAASRFRPDSELSRANTSPGRPRAVSPLFATAVCTALTAAAHTDGAVDPTMGRHLAALGYDRDIADVRRGATSTTAPATRAGWRDVVLDGLILTVPRGLALDLGATAKALTADRAASIAAARTGAGVLVAVGGDMAIAGPSHGGWSVQVAERPDDTEVQHITAYDGGLATSTTLARRWPADGIEHHHLLDPQTGRPVDGPWRTATVAAASCVQANTASTAALVLGADAEGWLQDRGLPARLVGRDGRITVCGDWPEEVAA
jgi:thiamine biosynthesis lipoprotein